MGSVVDLDSKRPHREGPCICTKCQHEWHGVVPVTEGLDCLECPSCKMYFGVFRGPEMPGMTFVCKCGGNLFYLTPDGHKCHSCGVESFTWVDLLDE